MRLIYNHNLEELLTMKVNGLQSILAKFLKGYTIQGPRQESDLMGSKPFWKIENYLILSAIQRQNISFYWISSKIDGFENPSLKIDGFSRTHRTPANAAPVYDVRHKRYQFMINHLFEPRHLLQSLGRVAWRDNWWTLFDPGEYVVQDCRYSGKG